MVSGINKALEVKEQRAGQWEVLLLRKVRLSENMHTICCIGSDVFGILDHALTYSVVQVAKR